MRPKMAATTKNQHIVAVVATSIDTAATTAIKATVDFPLFEREQERPWLSLEVRTFIHDWQVQFVIKCNF